MSSCPAASQGCVEVDEDDQRVRPLTLGRIASYYYLKYTTVALFCAELHDVDVGPSELRTMLRVLCDASEFDELPVRHNEEHVNAQMGAELPWASPHLAYESPHVKAQLLLQAHFARSSLPMADYVTDTKSVLDQALRVLQAMVDVAADGGWMHTAVAAMHLAQMVAQGRWHDAHDEHGLTDLPHIDTRAVRALQSKGVATLAQLAAGTPRNLRDWLRGTSFNERQLTELHALLRSLPRVSVEAQPPPPLAPGESSVVSVRLQALNSASRSKAFAPRFPKPKTAGWWLVMGEEDELIALKRVRIDRGSNTAELTFDAPDEPGEYVWSILLVSDTYIGLDQEAQVRIQVREGPAADAAPLAGSG